MSKDAKKSVIIKRPKKIEGGAHGGAWKVAFADFALSMMCFFLVMWILAVASQTERTRMAEAMNNYSLLDGSINPFSSEGMSTLLAEVAVSQDILQVPPVHSVDVMQIGNDFYQNVQDGDQNALVGQGDKMFDPKSPHKAQGLKQGNYDSQQELQELAQVVEGVIQESGGAENVMVEIVAKGLRIQIQDKDKRPIFLRGSAQLTPYFQKLLKSMAPIFEKVENGVILSGHSDASRFKSAAHEFGNWELSSARAMAARKALVESGMPVERLLQVNAYADLMPVRQDDPFAKENRRIEILIATKSAQKQIADMFGISKPELDATDDSLPLDLLRNSAPNPLLRPSAPLPTPTAN